MATSYSETGENNGTQNEAESKETDGHSELSPADRGEGATVSGPALPDAEAPGGDGPAFTLADLTGGHAEAMAGFDPSIHAVDSDGNPRKKRDGSFALKRGRKGGAAPAPAHGQTAPNTSGRLPPKARPAPAGGGVAPVAESAPVDYRAIAAAAVGTSLGIAVMTLGDEWRPKDKAEHGGLIDATAAYMESTGVQDIPPGWLLLAVVSAYALPRITAPTTKSRLLAGWLKIKGFFGRKKSPVSGESK